MSDTMIEVPAPEASLPELVLDAGDEQLVRQLAGRAAAGGLSLAGEGGLLAQLTKLVLEAGLEAEMSSHLGYAPPQAGGTPSTPWRAGTGRTPGTGPGRRR